MSYKMDNPELLDSVKSLKNYLSFLEGLRVVESWDEVVQTVFSKAHHLAFRVHPDSQDFLEWTTQLFVDLLMWPPGCPSKETTCRILEAYSLFGREVQEYMGWREDHASLDLLEHVLLDCDVSSLLSPASSSGYILANYRRKEYLVYAFARTDLRFLRATATYGLAMRLDMDGHIFRSFCPLLQKSMFKRVSMSGFSTMFENLKRNDGSTNGRDRRGFDRISGVVQALYATSFALRGRVSRAKNHASFLETYWDTLPDPLVSEEEIRDFLLFVEKEQRQVEIWYEPEPKQVVDVDRVMDAFVGLFGRRRGSYEPRSLSHLCRCAVRGAIVRNSPLTLPASLEGLHLPKTLQSFILCNPRWLSQ